MQFREDALKQPLDELKEQAVEVLESTLPPVIAWTRKVRPEDGTAGRFRWAVESTRPANVCIDLLNLQDATSWTGRWRLSSLEEQALRERIRAGLTVG
jgi:hypothetical protein